MVMGKGLQSFKKGVTICTQVFPDTFPVVLASDMRPHCEELGEREREGYSTFKDVAREDVPV